MRFIIVAGVLSAAMAAAGCLLEDTTHTLYLSSSGAVTWMALETDVRSNEEMAAKRAHEERQFLDAVAVESHPVAEGFRALGAEHIRTELIRPQRPYNVVTHAEFPRVDSLVERGLAELRIPGQARFEERGTRRTLTVVLDLTALEQSEASDTAVSRLVEGVDRYRVVLTHGRFLEATGFTISEDGAIAYPVSMSDEQLAATGHRVTLSLTWGQALN